MTAEQFLELVKAWPESVLLVTVDGTILGGSRSVEEHTGLSLEELSGKRLDDVAESTGDIPEYLRSCARSRQPVPGTIAFCSNGADKGRWRVNGAILHPRTDDRPALIMLRLTSQQSMVSGFLALNEKLDELSKEVRQRRRAQAELEGALHSKEVLLRELHHRVKNNLQVVSSLLELRATEAESPRELQVVQEIRSRIQVIALVHQQLYGMEDLEKLDLGEFLRELGRELIRVYKEPHQPIVVDIQAEQIDVNLDTAVNCGLLTHELVSNAVKHAFPDGRAGTVQVALNYSAVHEEAVLQVRDDGIGMPDTANVFNSQTLGMELIYSLARQIGGSISANTSSRGTAFTINFPA